MLRTILSLVTAFAVAFSANAQQNTVAAGGDMSGAGGTMSYSVGQVDYITLMSTSGSMAQGVQQAFGGCAHTDSSLTVVACNTYTVPSGDETYTVSGTYMDTIPNAIGCDSILTIQLYVNETPNITHFTSRTESQWRLNWEWTLPATPNDTNFRIRYWEQGFPAAFTDKSQFPGNYQKKITGLDDNTWYEVKVGFACLDGSFIWGGTESVKTKKITCSTPENLSQTLPLAMHQATVNWDDQGATSYKVRRRLQGTSTWDYSNVSTNSKSFGGLNAASTYEYQVKALCTNGLWSSYTDIATFETAAPAMGGSFGRLAAEEFEEMSLFPNPNSGEMTLTVPSEGAPFNLQLFDRSGRLIHSETVNEGRQQLSLKGVTQGVYTMIARPTIAEVQPTTLKVIIQ